MDEQAVRDLYDASYRRLVGQLTTFTGSRSEAEDTTVIDNRGDQLSLLAGASQTRAHGSVWRLPTSLGTWQGYVNDTDTNQAFAWSKGFVVAPFNTSTVTLIDLDGTTQTLRKAAARPARPGDVALGSDLRTVRLADPAGGVWWSVALPAGTRPDNSAVVNDDGSLWVGLAAANSKNGPALGLFRSTDGRTWAHGTLATPPPGAIDGLLLADGKRMAAITARVADDANPVVQWSTSVDGGASWSTVPASAVPFGGIGVESMAASPSGTLFVADIDGRLRRSTGDWTHFTRVPLSRRLQEVTRSPDGVVVSLGSLRTPTYRNVDDAGVVTAWAPGG